MRVLGVIDLSRGRAVHARGGARDRYEPTVKTVGRPITPGDALALAQSYCFELGVDELYVADLDAIVRGQPQDALIVTLVETGAPLWLDAGIKSPVQATRARGLGARVVVGLETLPSFEALEEICSAIDGERVAFSLDLRDGQPLIRHGGAIAAEPATTIAARAAAAGARTIIVLDLARVGSGSGLDFDLIARVRDAAPHVSLMAGGGVRDASDLIRLDAAGCNGALVASALLSGRLRLPFRRT